MGSLQELRWEVKHKNREFSSNFTEKSVHESFRDEKVEDLLLEVSTESGLRKQNEKSCVICKSMRGNVLQKTVSRDIASQF